MPYNEIKNDEYRFSNKGFDGFLLRIQAKNSFGTSEPSESINIQMLVIATQANIIMNKGTKSLTKKKFF